jgi:hypothetical protein
MDEGAKNVREFHEAVRQRVLPWRSVPSSNQKLYGASEFYSIACAFALRTHSWLELGDEF